MQMRPAGCRLRTVPLVALVLSSLLGQGASADDPAQRLAQALRFQTISYQDPSEFRSEPFHELHAFLERSFPAVHASLERERVAELSLLYSWPGSDASLPPILLTSHLDVVPVPPGTEEAWSRPPFGGVIADGFVWGRGALDNKSGVLATLEAVESLAGAGFAPTRTLYLAFGHDEELGGSTGAAAISALLAARGVRVWFSLDEGMVIVEDAFPGIDQSVAMIGVAEKGVLTLELTARSPGGHSSMPPPSGSIGRLARAVQKLEENPLPPRIGRVASGLLDALSPQLPFLQRLAIEQRWLLGPLLERVLTKNSATNAMIRTTTAVTVIRAGDKANVLPRSATALVNFRLIPGDSVEWVTEQVRAIIDDPEIEIEVQMSREASSVSSSDSQAYSGLRRAIESVAPDAIVAPALVLAGTDSKHYGSVADDAYRFLPIVISQEDRTRFHGVNERISIQEFERAIRFYRSLIESTAGPAR